MFIDKSKVKSQKLKVETEDKGKPEGKNKSHST
jgi:hypothetical protein